MRSATEISQNLRIAAARKQLTQERLAAATGVDQSQISRMLNGKFASSSPNLVKLCVYLGVAVEQDLSMLQPAEAAVFARLSTRAENLSGFKRREFLRLLTAVENLMG